MITELVREERIEEILSYYNKDRKGFFKIRLIYTILLTLIAAMFILYSQKYNLFYVPIIAMVVGYKMPYYSLLSKKSKDDYLNSYLFPELIENFMALIPSSGNVYQALVAVLPYSRGPLKERLGKLIEKIEEDNRREDYLEFANYVGTSEAYMVMDMIYQFSEFGIKKEALKELQDYIAEIQKNRVDELIEKKMGSMEGLGYIPIFISMFTIIGFAGVLFVYYMGGVTGSLSTIGIGQ